MELTEGKEYWIKAKFLGELSKSANDEPYIPERRYAFRVGIRETSIDFSLVDFEAVEALPEREKVVIPKFVAKQIEYCKKLGCSLFYAMNHCFQYEESADWLEDNQDTFARAWLEGYEVEKESLYVVELPDAATALYSFSHLKTDVTGRIIISHSFDSSWKTREENQFTEKEIKDYDERYWAFAVPVEEDDE